MKLVHSTADAPLREVKLVSAILPGTVFTWGIGNTPYVKLAYDADGRPATMNLSSNNVAFFGKTETLVGYKEYVDAALHLGPLQ